MARTGRPNAWKELIEPRKDEIVTWVKAGATNKECAEALGVSYSTYMEHIGKHADFSDSLKQARMTGAPEIKLALYRRALGFHEKETKTSMKGEDGEVNIETTMKYYPPDVGAIQTWLRNYGDGFRDKDKFTYDFKEVELELKKELMKMKEW